MAVIFYLSGTGNSLYAAKSIAQELEQCRLEGITGYLIKWTLYFLRSFLLLLPIRNSYNPADF